MNDPVQAPKIYAMRRLRDDITSPEIHFDAHKLNLLASISRENFTQSSSAEVNAQIGEFILFGLVTRKNAGSGERYFATVNGTRLLNLAAQGGWTEGED